MHPLAVLGWETTRELSAESRGEVKEVGDTQRTKCNLLFTYVRVPWPENEDEVQPEQDVEQITCRRSE